MKTALSITLAIAALSQRARGDERRPVLFVLVERLRRKRRAPDVIGRL